VPRRYEWRAPQWVHRKFRSLIVDLDDFPEDSDIAAAIRDEIRSLPNYPAQSTERDEIYPVSTTIR
jgi:hypothetical protein